MSQGGEFGVGDDGEFNKKSVDDIREDLKSQLRKEFGGDIELRPSSPLLQLVDTFAIQMARAWDAAEGTYFSSSYQDALGQQLDQLLAIANFEREPLQGATGEVTFSRDTPATSDVIIPRGTVVTTARTDVRPPIPFETIQRVTIDEGETERENVEIEALRPWQTDVDEEWLGEETNVGSDTITRFESPVAGVDSVTNPLATGDVDEGFERGRDRESDAEYRLRYRTTFGSDGNATVSNVEANVFTADDRIASVKLVEIRDEAENEYGINVIVLGDDAPDEDIGESIFNARSAGIQTFGEEEVTIEYGGDEYTERFDRAERVDVYVDAELTTTDTFPDDGEDRIISNIIDYLGGEDVDGNRRFGLEIGEDVVYDQVKRGVLEVRGVVSADVFIGLSEDPTDTENITINDMEAARGDVEIINITE